MQMAGRKSGHFCYPNAGDTHVFRERRHSVYCNPCGCRIVIDKELQRSSSLVQRDVHVIARPILVVSRATMKAVWSQIADFLRRKPVCCRLVVAASDDVCPLRARGRRNPHPRPQHEWANYYQAVVVLLYHSFSVALLAALTSTVALWAGQRTMRRLRLS
jgi:hypothetical protein